MTATPHSDSTDSLTDPGMLADRDGVAVETQSVSVDADEFETARTYDSQVVVGVPDERGALLQNDGHHGWTLPAFPVADGEDYAAVARREFEALTGAALGVAGVEHARRRVFVREADGAEAVVWNVLLRGAPASPLPDDPESRVDGTDARWSAEPPADASAPVVADVERVLDWDDTPAPARQRDPTESLTDPAAYRDADGVDYVEVSDDSHFETNRDTAGVTAVAVTNAAGELALVRLENATVVPWAKVDAGGDFAAAASEAVAPLGVDVDLNELVRVRRKVSAREGAEEDAVAYDVLFAASPVDGDDLADDPANDRVESVEWVDSVPADVPEGNMRADAALFLD
ncbi:MAG: hypothetical protein ABEJ88_03220 [Halobacterium sp.]